MTMKFIEYYKLITESDDFTVLSSKKFKGQNIIKVSLFRYKDGEKYRVVTTSLQDPSYSGYVDFNDKAKSIVAFNNISTYDNLVRFMDDHKKDPEAFDFAIILDAEKEKGMKPQESPFDVVPFSEPGMGMPSEIPPMAGGPAIPGMPSPTEAPASPLGAPAGVPGAAPTEVPSTGAAPAPTPPPAAPGTPPIV